MLVIISYFIGYIMITYLLIYLSMYSIYLPE